MQALYRRTSVIKNALLTTERNYTEDDNEKSFIDDLQAVKLIANSQSPIYLTFSPSHRRYFAMKIYPYIETKTSPQYLNERRYSELDHPNIIKFHHVQDEQIVSDGDQEAYVSLIVFELAKFDFAHFSSLGQLVQDEKLVRTYFHQLIAAVEYLHSKKIAHLDIKMENLLLGEDLQLKLADFDGAYTKGDSVYLGSGSPNYRAPERISKRCSDPFKADVFSMGIILFVLRTGFLPYFEKKQVAGYDLLQLLMNNPTEYWEALSSIDEQTKSLSKDFKELFISMTKKTPSERLNLMQVKESQWLQGPRYTSKQLYSLVKLK
jgi:serine/threonine protein kinase